MESESNIKMMKDSEQAILSEAKRYVGKNILTVAEGRECVDGRYDQRRTEGPLGRAGADVGYVMGLLYLKNEGIINLTAEECVDAVYKAVTKDGGKFYAHTDHHAKEKGNLIGCGHIMGATLPENSELYGVNPSDVVNSLNYIHDITKHENLEEPELKGEHEEKGVLVVNSDNYVVDHHDENKMYFVYDKKLDLAFVDKLAEEMNIPGVTIENFTKALDHQTDATLKELAPGKPIFKVDIIDRNNFTVDHVKDVPKKD